MFRDYDERVWKDSEIDKCIVDGAKLATLTMERTLGGTGWPNSTKRMVEVVIEEAMKSVFHKG